MMLLPLWILTSVLALVCVIWTIIRIARSSGLLAFCTFLFFPLGIIHLVRHWGDDDLDIRVPFLAAIVFQCLNLFLVYRMWGWTTDPAAVEQALYESLAGQVGIEEEDENAGQINRQIAIAGQAGSVSYMGGRVPLPDAHASVEVPEHFRFARAEDVRALAASMDRPLPPGAQGWIVHDRVSLSERGAWFVEVRWFPIGHVAEGDAASLDPARLLSARERVLSNTVTSVPIEWKGFVIRPDRSAETGTIVWSELTHYLDRDVELVNCYAYLPGRAGVLRYSVEFLQPGRAELGYRAVRLLASRTRFDQDWNHADYSTLWDKNSKRTVADVVSGEAFR